MAGPETIPTSNVARIASARKIAHRSYFFYEIASGLVGGQKLRGRWLVSRRRPFGDKGQVIGAGDLDVSIRHELVRVAERVGGIKTVCHPHCAQIEETRGVASRS